MKSPQTGRNHLARSLSSVRPPQVYLAGKQAIPQDARHARSPRTQLSDQIWPTGLTRQDMKTSNYLSLYSSHAQTRYSICRRPRQQTLYQGNSLPKGPSAIRPFRNRNRERLWAYIPQSPFRRTLAFLQCRRNSRSCSALPRRSENVYLVYCSPP